VTLVAPSGVANLPWLDSAKAGLQEALARARLPQGILVHGAVGCGRRELTAWLVRQLLPDARLRIAESGSADPLQLMEHPDLTQLRPPESKSQITVAQIRELIGQLGLTPLRQGMKVAVLYPAEAMNATAANALLKTLEEPPGPSCVILVTTSLGRLPATIVSRCLKVRIPAPDPRLALAWLAAQIGPAGGDELLRMAGGGPLLAMALASDQCRDQLASYAIDLEKLGRREDSPVAVARRWVRGQPDLALSWLQVRTHNLLLHAANAAPVASRDNLSLQFHRRLGNMVACHEQWTRTGQARRMLERGLNVELLLAELLLWWFGGAEAPR
jgi:DNA polymerase III subunit delta'